MINATMPRPLNTAIDAGSGTIVAVTAIEFTFSVAAPDEPCSDVRERSRQRMSTGGFHLMPCRRL
jgi:hypothetical protein